MQVSKKKITESFSFLNSLTLYLIDKSRGGVEMKILFYAMSS